VTVTLAALPDATHILHERWSSIDALLEGSRHADGLLRLDLGCGWVKPEGFVGADNLPGSDGQVVYTDNAPDLFLDLNRDPLPLPDACCSEVRASHFLEHSNLPHIFAEVHRLLAPGGTFMFVVPYANSAQGMYPGHNIFLTETWFQENTTFQELFRIVETRFDRSQVWEELPGIVRRVLPFDVARKVLFNVCHQMWMWATPRK
jgi:SAM-dependent methyltransferase